MSFQVDKEHEVGFVYFIVISNINFGLYSNEYAYWRFNSYGFTSRSYKQIFADAKSKFFLKIYTLSPFFPGGGNLLRATGRRSVIWYESCK